MTKASPITSCISFRVGQVTEARILEEDEMKEQPTLTTEIHLHACQRLFTLPHRGNSRAMTYLGSIEDEGLKDVQHHDEIRSPQAKGRASE